MAKKYKALMVEDKTHNKVIVEAAKNNLTVDGFVLFLLKLYGTSKQKRS